MSSGIISLTRKLDGAPPVLPPISPLIERRKLQPSSFEPVAEALEKGGFSVGWNEGSLQVGGSLAQSGLCSPALSSRSSYRPRTSGFLSFSRSKDVHPRQRAVTSRPSPSGPSAPLPAAPLTPPLTPRPRRATPIPRFTRLAISLDSATANALLSSASEAGILERQPPRGPSLRAAATEPGSLQVVPPTSSTHDSASNVNGNGAAAAAAGGPRPHSGPASDAATATTTTGVEPSQPPRPASYGNDRDHQQINQNQQQQQHAGSHAGSGASSVAASAAGSAAGSMAGAGAAGAPLPSSAKVASTLGMSVPAQNLKDCDRPGTGMVASMRYSGPIIQVPLGVPSPRSHLAQTQAFKANRGHALLVFNELDSDKNGKVCRSEFEAAALSLGFSLDQVQRFWDRLDRRRRGYLEAMDWGTKDAMQQIQLFSTRYMQKYMGVPDISSTPEQVRKYQRSQEVMQIRSLPAAINMVRANAVARGMRSAGASGNPVYETFRFMDVDGSGHLTKEEIRDGFFALGVYLAENVMEQIMQVFDKNNSGTVQYHEFERTMFPPLRGT